MKANVNSTGRLFGLACIAIWLAIQAWPPPLRYSHRDSQRSFKCLTLAADSSGARGPLSDRVNVSKEKAAEIYSSLPLRFEANHGQADSRVRFLSRAGGFNLYLTANDAVVELRGSTSPSSREAKRNSENANPQSSVVRMKLTGANPAARVVGLDELPGKSNYFIGNDPKKWRTNVPAYSRVKYQNAYPGVDVLYYGNQQQLEYDFISLHRGHDRHVPTDSHERFNRKRSRRL